MWEKVAILAVVLAFITGVIGGRKYESNKHTEELVAIQAQNEVKLKELTARKDETISLIIKSKASDAADLAALTKHVSTTSVAPIESFSGMPQELMQSQSKRVDSYSQRVQDFIEKVLNYSETSTRD